MTVARNETAAPAVTTTNALQSVSVNPAAAIERAVVTYRLTGTCLAGTTGNVTAGSTVSGNCSGAAGGPATMGWTCGNVKPPTDCTITKTAKTATITVNNDPSDAISGGSCTIASVAEGSSAALGCTYSWNNSEGNCNTATANADTDAHVTGANCTKNAAKGRCSEFNCDDSNWSCGLNWGATTAATSTYSCLNNDTISAVVIKPDSSGCGGAGSTINFATNSTISWTGNGTGSLGAANACTEPACNKAAKATWADPAGCGTLATATCLWTGGFSGCSERITLTDAHNAAITDGATTAIGACGVTKPIINNIFPLDFAARFKGNAHTDQVVTLLFNNTILSGGSPLTSVHMTCNGSDASQRIFVSPTNCTLGSQDVP